MRLLLVVTTAVIVLKCHAESQCAATGSVSSDYVTAANAHTDLSLQTFAGLTRSVVKPLSYSLVTPESRVYGGPPPGWKGARSAAVVTPALGAHFSMYLVDADQDAEMASAVKFELAPRRLERLIYVLQGTLTITNSSNKESRLLGAGGFVYYAPDDDTLSTKVDTNAVSFILIDRQYEGRGGAQSVIGMECEIEEEICDGEVFKLRRLLDKNDEAFDFNIHIMDFEPGEYLNVKEVHYNQHGLLMLKGHGIYMLGSDFYPVSAGDAIYMAPFVPQWYGALGKETSRYFLYKDTNVNPLLST